MKYKNTLTSRSLNFTLSDGKGKDTEIVIGPGETVDLPEDNSHVKSLEALKYIERVKESVTNPKKDN